MRSKPVFWTDGMLMLPHHFQAAEAYLHEYVAESHAWQAPFGYGLHLIEINEEALSNFELRIPRLQARLRDGTLLSIPENAHLPTTDLRGALENDTEVYVHLALPEIVPGGANSSLGETSDGVRFSVASQEWEEIHEGDNPRSIDTLRFAPQIHLSESRQSPKGYDSVVIGRLRRGSEVESPPVLDPRYIPPLLNCDTWSALRDQILGTVAARLGSYIKAQAEYLRVHGGWNEANQPQIRRAIAQLSAVNASYPLFVQMVRGRGVHPQRAYFELCRLVGQLSILREEWQPPDLPIYDHEDLGHIFWTVKEIIEEILAGEGVSSKVQRHPFICVGDWLEVTLDPRWLQGAYEFYIGVRSNLPPERLEQLFSSRWLDWKLGSSRTIQQIYANAEAGVSLRRVVGIHRMLPALSNLTYFKVSTRSSYWEQVVDGRTLALKVNERYIRRKTVGQGAITVSDPKNTPRDLFLELFVVEND